MYVERPKSQGAIGKELTLAKQQLEDIWVTSSTIIRQIKFINDILPNTETSKFSKQISN